MTDQLKPFGDDAKVILSARFWLAVAGVAVLLGALSAVLVPGLGHDAWAWMIWAREIPQLSLDTTTGATIKPLPMLLMAPVAWLGDAAPFLWLSLSRAGWLIALVVAWWLGSLIGGRLAGWFAAAGVALVLVLFDASINGYCESLIALSLLGAIVALRFGRVSLAMVLVATAGLMRPEAWAFAVVLAIWGVRTRQLRPSVGAVLCVMPIVIWAGLSWWGAGEPFGGPNATESIRAAGGVFGPLVKGSAPVVWLGGVLALIFAIRERNRVVLMLLALSASWVVLFCALVALGFSGNSRYLVPAEVIAAVAAGWGLAHITSLVGSASARRLVVAVITVMFLASLAVELPSARDSVSRFSRNATIAEELHGAVSVAGGRDAVVSLGKPIVMNWSRRTALAWQLNVPITATQVIWGPDWTGSIKLPAFLFASPSGDGNTRAPLPANIRLSKVGESGEWAVYKAERMPRRPVARR